MFQSQRIYSSPYLFAKPSFLQNEFFSSKCVECKRQTIKHLIKIYKVALLFVLQAKDCVQTSEEWRCDVVEQAANPSQAQYHGSQVKNYFNMYKILNILC